jgi:hypothetical protein
LRYGSRCPVLAGGGESSEVFGGVAGGLGRTAEDLGSLIGANGGSAGGPGGDGRRLAGLCGPAVAQLGKGQVWGEPAAAVPDGLAVGVVVTGKPDRVPGDLAGVDGAFS